MNLAHFNLKKMAIVLTRFCYVQVVILNDQTESRTVKLGLHLPEPCVALEIISSTNDPNKHKEASCLLLGKSGHIYAYNDCMIERYLLECQARSPPSLPKQMKIKLPFTDSSITVAKLFTYNSHLLSFTDEVCSLKKKQSSSYLSYYHVITPLVGYNMIINLW